MVFPILLTPGHIKSMVNQNTVHGHDEICAPTMGLQSSPTGIMFLISSSVANYSDVIVTSALYNTMNTSLSGGSCSLSSDTPVSRPIQLSQLNRHSDRL